MRPFLFLATRAEDAAADDEYAAMLRVCGLDERQLRRKRLERQPLGEIDLDEWSGIIVGGGPFCVSDPEDTKSPVQRRVESELASLVERVVAADSPFFGACYGLGQLAINLGGSVDRTYAESVQAVPITLTAAGLTDPLFGAMPATFGAFVGHKEAVTAVPAGLTVLASGVACPVQAVRAGANVYATQFHPELDAQGIAVRVGVYRTAGYFPADQADELISAARQADVSHAAEPLAAFVTRYGRCRSPRC